MIGYQYRGLSHAQMVFHLDNTHDIDANNCKKLFDFINRNFVTEIPQSKGIEIKIFIGGTIKMHLQLNTKRRQFKWFECIVYIVVQRQLMDAKKWF